MFYFGTVLEHNYNKMLKVLHNKKCRSTNDPITSISIVLVKHTRSANYNCSTV